MIGWMNDLMDEFINEGMTGWMSERINGVNEWAK